MSSYDYDYLVIGGGSGGVSSARRAAGYGKKVAVIEGARWGGTCVNVGCVPKKIMFQAAQIYETVKADTGHYEISGVDSKSVEFQWKTLKEKRDKYIVRLNNIYLNNLKKSGVDVFEGWASFVDPHTVQINMNDGSSKTVTGANILLATGGTPMLTPEVPGFTEHCITSDGFFELEERPNKAVVVGAGYIAVELAGVLAALGCDTHLVVRKHMALREFDPDIASFLHNVMSAHEHTTIHTNTMGLASIQADPIHAGKKLVTTVKGGGEDGSQPVIIDNIDIVLVALGRVPKVEGLGLDKAGVKQDDRKGYVIADEFQKTSVEHIYALGDLCGKVELTPMAIAAGRRLSDRLFGGMPDAKTSYENVPTVVFSHPTIGVIGLTEPKAEAKYGKDNLKIYRSTFVNLYYSMYNMEPSDKPKSFMKVICAGVEEKVVGLHMIGMGSDEILQGFGVSMKMGMTKADMDSCIAIHPTAAEELVTMAPWGTSPQYSGAKVSPLMGAPAGEPTLNSKM